VRECPPDFRFDFYDLAKVAGATSFLAKKAAKPDAISWFRRFYLELYGVAKEYYQRYQRYTYIMRRTTRGAKLLPSRPINVLQTDMTPICHLRNRFLTFWLSIKYPFRKTWYTQIYLRTRVHLTAFAIFSRLIWEYVR
jgi:hypothetical protein